MALSFAFGGDDGSTYDDLKRRQALAQALWAGASRNTPRTAGEGLASAAQSITGALLSKKLGQQIKSEQDEFGMLFNGALGGFGQTQPAGGGYAPNPNDQIADSTMQALGKADFSGDRQQFVEAMMPHALRVSQQTGLDPRLVIAQAAQETGWGKHAPGNNFFGIKSHGKPGGNTMATNEVVNGQTVRVNDSFRGYGSMGESADGYASFLQENPRYRDMLSAPDLDSQLAALGRSGYATDPNYAQSVGSIARSIQLPQGGATGGVNPMLLAMAGDPRATPEQRSVLQMLLQQQMQAADPMRQLQMQNLQGQIDARANPQTKYDIQELADGRKYYIDPTGKQAPRLVGPDVVPDPKGNSTEYGVTPQYITDANGKLGMVVLGKDGTAKTVELPEGSALQKGIEKLDLGTSYQWHNTLTGEAIGEPIPKDLAGAESEKAQGRIEGENTATAKAELGGAIAAADQSVKLIESIISDPALAGITGMLQGRLPPMSQAGIDLNVKIEQLKGKAFLEAFESLKGGGTITEREGAAATAAMARLDRAQSTDEYVAALQELADIMRTGVERAKEKAGMSIAAPVAEISETINNIPDFGSMTDEQLEAYIKQNGG